MGFFLTNCSLKASVSGAQRFIVIRIELELALVLALALVLVTRSGSSFGSSYYPELVVNDIFKIVARSDLDHEIVFL